MENFKHQYRNLEQRVIHDLREKVDASKTTSKHVDAKAIAVNLNNYAELTVVNDRLTLLDHDGYHYSIYNDVSLEDLIDVLASA
jgi:hypothetical protein